MESTVMSCNIDFFFFFERRCHKRNAEEHANFLQSRLEELLVFSRKSEEKLRDFSSITIFVPRFFALYKQVLLAL